MSEGRFLDKFWDVEKKELIKKFSTTYPKPYPDPYCAKYA